MWYGYQFYIVNVLSSMAICSTLWLFYVVWLFRQVGWFTLTHWLSSLLPRINRLLSLSGSVYNGCHVSSLVSGLNHLRAYPRSQVFSLLVLSFTGSLWSSCYRVQRTMSLAWLIVSFQWLGIHELLLLSQFLLCKRTLVCLFVTCKYSLWVLSFEPHVISGKW